MIDPGAVDMARLQFAATALYHFLFVPLTLGMTFILAIMETVYVMTGKNIYLDMTRFWGKLFGINFALGVTTGLTMEFQFGTNWSYYSHYVGDIFGAPLAIEGLLAFFLESTFVGLFFFGWDRLSKVGHLTVTYLVAIGSNLSALLILIANGWMQNPVGAEFNPVTMRMEMASFWDLVFNPAAQAKFVHTVSSGYVTASVFVLGISSWYLLKGRDLEFARRSFRVAAAFGLASALSVVVLGDESGYAVTEHQQTKLAAMEGMWRTEAAPAGLTLFGIPDEAAHTNHAEVKIPYLLGLIATRSSGTVLPGIDRLQVTLKQRIESGAVAVSALERMRRDKNDVEAVSQFNAHKADMGYGLLLKQYTADVAQATPEMVARAVDAAIPPVAPLFWSFRIMVALGFAFIALFVIAFWASAKNSFEQKPWLLRWALLFIPMPWVATQVGWIVAEVGRQPWTVHGVLPTHLSASTLTANEVMLSLTGFLVFYTLLLIAELYLMFKYARLGPSSLGTGVYHHESGGVLPHGAVAAPISSKEV
ncbi:MAG: cytochrome d terminal oxidase subunit 1 [Hydrogenophilales bacterium CG03_land_8_20_14_0_80_62_28]|nr:cytochrome bd-I ubiquinol oxidase subunit CydA [Betaproteobacteria bacterium]PIV23755.1 MAG: cytochrome d terminal oxidase subunit 1 [Hydrogenophilales bacterium CG03_land_8_20_14_0_80_62_28]PIW71078.1 MAG: cytochrome d terminal oxidase subunit 1 [Hydrogenophilales bacterium CG12_big_fil_rev_8_21_14_0_65_61_21]PIX02749.1 MAG: cytochrome d terminal oxidase subunit 1 [Hydrogenophilales bacterium CG_4_8_14_3_um_filter_62_83]